MKVTVSCGCKFHSDLLAEALANRGQLERLLTAHPRSRMRRAEVPLDKARFLMPVYLPGMAAAKLGLSTRLQNELNWWACRTFDLWASEELGSPGALVAWAWSARRTLELARRQGIYSLLEECGSCNAYQEALLAEEHNRLGLPKRRGLDQRFLENERAECETADALLCPSEYVANSFSAIRIPREKCVVLPYAANSKLFTPDWNSPKESFKVLYVGSVSVRKGVFYLLEALKGLRSRQIECTIIGQIEPAFARIFSEYRGLIKYIRAVPNEEIVRYYREATVFVLPTLDEGMAYVALEALACGLPVITTPHSGAEGTIRDGQNGFLVPVRDSHAIAERLQLLIERPGLVEQMGQAAAATAHAHSWAEYAAALVREIDRRSHAPHPQNFPART